MTNLPTTSPAPAGTDPTPDDLRRRRIRAMTVWLVAFVIGWVSIGLPTDPAYAFCWLWTVTIAWRPHLPWRAHIGFARDWLPVVLLLAVYNLSRGFADELSAPHVRELINADLSMFGWLTGGTVPTVWLQQHLYSETIQWYDIMVSWVYFSHFVVAMGAAVILWLRSRARWAAFMRRWFALSAAGLATYFVYPAAPPWWAAQYGYLNEEVLRISTRGWKAFGLHGAGNMLNVGQIASNPVAAMPSLHTAFALFVVLFFLPVVARRWWPLLLSYPLAMTFTLVYSGEHYMIDVLIGWLYVVAVLVLVSAGERGWAAYQRRRVGPGGPAGHPTETLDPAGHSAALGGDLDQLPEPRGDEIVPDRRGIPLDHQGQSGRL